MNARAIGKGALMVSGVYASRLRRLRFPGVVVLNGKEQRVAGGDHYRDQLDDFCAAIRGEHPPLIGHAEMRGQARVLAALLRGQSAD